MAPIGLMCIRLNVQLVLHSLQMLMVAVFKLLEHVDFHTLEMRV
jgi:hypothetical protein